MKKIVYSFLLLPAAFSCSKKTEEPVPPASGPAVYISGFSRNAADNGTYACYWKNGVQVALTSNNTSGSDASAEDIAVSGNDVYVAGGEKNASGKYVARYWKNGVATDLTNGAEHGYASGIEVNGTDVYIAFQEMNAAGKYVAKYWKNGVVTNLSDGSVNTGVQELALSGSDVYVLGVEASVPRVIKYWKNGNAVTLPLTVSTNANFYDITVAGNDVYVSGNEFDPSGTFSRAMIYKNTTAMPLTNSLPPANAWGGVAVNGSDVYAGGMIYNTPFISTAIYWKNGAAVTLGDGITNSAIRCMFVNNTDVYACGTITNASGKNVLTYWKNGVATTVSNGVQSSSPTGILVK